MVCVVIGGPPFGLEALEWFGDWLRGRFLIYL
jgi:ribosome-binding protein aMBF1 (putative translation factor)